MGERIRILGGIDEAGLGPLLGPLVIGGLALAGPEGRTPWQTLAKSFCKKPRSRKDRRIRVDDSKRVNQGPRGRAELERTALALTFAATGRVPATLAELLAAPAAAGDLGAYPWYEGIETVSLPRWNDAGTLELDAHLAAKTLERTGIRALGYPFRVVDVGTFNRLIRRHDNKGVALFDATAPVLAALVRAAHAVHEASPDAEVTIVVDRHGGRSHYHGLLERAFPGAHVAILSEAATASTYMLGERTELHFVEHGEDRSFPTAAASCLAKYVRELCVERINDWFVERRPGLKRTAGYYADGRRFLEDLGALRAEVPRELLVRIR